MKTINIIYFILFLALLSGCVKDNGEAAEEYVQVGDSVPVFTVNDYDSAETIGKITLITFFDPECRDCRRELPLLQNAYNLLKYNNEFQMINIARGRTLENLAEANEGATWLSMPCYPDLDREIYNLFATSTIPRIYLVDRDGIVREKWVENTHMAENEQGLEAFIAIIESYLETP